MLENGLCSRSRTLKQFFSALFEFPLQFENTIIYRRNYEFEEPNDRCLLHSVNKRKQLFELTNTVSVSANHEDEERVCTFGAFIDIVLASLLDIRW